MKIYFTNYSDQNYSEQQNALNLFAKNQGIFDDIVPYTRDFIENTTFYSESKHILDQKRGGGFCLWKPYILLDLLSKMENDDVVFYMDAADMFCCGIEVFLKNYMEHNDLMITAGSFRNDSYTTSKCFELMNCNEKKYKLFTQVEAGIICVKKTDFSIKFIKEWLLFCKDENIITDIHNDDLNNSCNFIDNRYDQSILTNLVVKYNIPTTNEIRNYTTCNIND